MKYRDDPDLTFLSSLTAEQLDPLVTMLTHDKDGGSRCTEELTDDPKFKKYRPDHTKYWRLIAGELQGFGANTLTTIIFRGGKGILYREVLTDVCDQLKVNYNKEAVTSVIEWNLLLKVLLDSVTHMLPDEMKSFLEEMEIPHTSFTAEAVTAAIQAAIRAGKFPAYRVAVVVANAVLKAAIGRGLPIAANAALTKAMGIAVGPIGWVLTALWTLVDIAGPAYRITVPAVIYVSYLRIKPHNA